MRRDFTRPCRSSGRILFGLGAAVLLSGCNSEILKVEDPDIIVEANSAAGALALKNGVILRLTQATNGIQGPDALFIYSGLLADEWKSGDTFVQRNDMDQRLFDPNNTFLAGPFRSLNRVRVEGRAAVDALRTYSPTPLSNIGLMFAVTAYAHNLAGEIYCNGVPVSFLEGQNIRFGEPLAVDSVFGLAIAAADSALANLTGVDSARVRQLASVVKGRALLNRNRYTEAAAAVTNVATTFRYEVTHSLFSTENQTWLLNNDARRYTIADREGLNGLPFVSANDPRVPRRIAAATDLTFDTFEPVVRQGIWGRTSSVAIATGIEARLVEAEAALRDNVPVTWLRILNDTLRANTALYPPVQTGFTRPAPPLPAMTDPGTLAARVDSLFYERAFWMFGSGHRLGDLRRLIRQFNRPRESVFPTGAWFKGGTYGAAVNIPVSIAEQNNPNFVECTDRNP
ncbi:MAG: hypothetical protein ACREMM_06215 [Gemmatimonadales bacterium]